MGFFKKSKSTESSSSEVTSPKLSVATSSTFDSRPPPKSPSAADVDSRATAAPAMEPKESKGNEMFFCSFNV